MSNPAPLQGRHRGLPPQIQSVPAAPPVIGTGPVSYTVRDRPSPHFNPPGSGSCPVHILARQSLSSARSLARLLSRLRVSMNQCRSCPTNTSCPLPAEFNAQLTIALQEIADEWRLG